MKPVAAARPARPGRPAITQPAGFESLDATHREAVKMLRALEQLLPHVSDNGPDEAARTSAREIMAFFSGPARQHHADEEALVFPDLLGSSDEAMVQHVRRLQQDHGWLEEDWLQLSPHIEAIASGYNWYDLEMLRKAVPVFWELYREHIVLEEAIVYPAAKRLREAAASPHKKKG
jgi:hemerythrin-like domain-containing protein